MTSHAVSHPPPWIAGAGARKSHGAKTSALGIVLDRVHSPKPPSRATVCAQLAKLQPRNPAPFVAPEPWLHDVILSGASGHLLKSFAAFFDLSRDQLASLLDATPKTVRNREVAKRLPRADVEKISRYMRVWAAACLAFEDEAYASQWVHDSNEALGHKTPFELLASGDGERMVLNDLGRIEHGLPV